MSTVVCESLSKIQIKDKIKWKLSTSQQKRSSKKDNSFKVYRQLTYRKERSTQLLLAVQSTPNPPTVPTIWIPTQMFLAEKDGSLLILQRESGSRSAVNNLSFGAGSFFREVEIRICGWKKQDSSLLSMARYGRRSMEGKYLVPIKTKTLKWELTSKKWWGREQSEFTLTVGTRR